MRDKWEKKSERFEVRLPYSIKSAFVTACENQGDVPSNAMRRFIEAYIKRSDYDGLKQGLKALGRILRRNWKSLTGISASALTLGVFISWSDIETRALEKAIAKDLSSQGVSMRYKYFVKYDKNKDGVLTLGEVSDRDEHLHRVLNLDGKDGISLEEFRLAGHMSWRFENEDSLEPNINIVRFDFSKPWPAKIRTSKYKYVNPKIKIGHAEILHLSGKDVVGFSETPLGHASQYIVWKPGHSRPILIAKTRKLNNPV